MTVMERIASIINDIYILYHRARTYARDIRIWPMFRPDVRPRIYVGARGPDAAVKLRFISM